MTSNFDYTKATFTTGPRGLANLMNSTSGESRLWNAKELEAIFRHQLDAPVFLDLSYCERKLAKQLKAVSDAEGLLLKNFSNLFAHPAPPIELLEAVKDFAKSNMNHPESLIPNEVATALYFTSIATALLRANKRITSLSDNELGLGLKWVVKQEWIDDRTRHIVLEARDIVFGCTKKQAESHE